MGLGKNWINLEMKIVNSIGSNGGCLDCSRMEDLIEEGEGEEGVVGGGMGIELDTL